MRRDVGRGIERDAGGVQVGDVIDQPLTPRPQVIHRPVYRRQHDGGSDLNIRDRFQPITGREMLRRLIHQSFVA